MIDHTGINVSDINRSRIFYDQALNAIGYELRVDRGVAAGFGPASPEQGGDPAGDFWITKGAPVTPRTHIAFRVLTRAEVDAFYRAAIAAGGQDNGAPEVCPEYHPNYYAGFVFDPDGYNIEAVCHLPPTP